MTAKRVTLQERREAKKQAKPLRTRPVPHPFELPTIKER